MFTTWKELSIAGFLLSTCLVCTGVNAVERVPAKGPAPASGKLLITGASTMTPMVVAIGKRYSTMHPGVQIEVQTVGTAGGIDDVRKGRADIGMVARALTDDESGLYSFAIARDGICLIVHKDNPVRTLTNQQVVDIYTGKVNRWSSIGGKDAPVVPINVREGLGSVELFTRYFGIKYAEIKAPIVVGEDLERIKALIENPNGITYVSIGTAQQQADSGAPIKLLPINGVAATTRNVRIGNFPISRPLVLLTKDVPTGLAKDFISFSLSSQITDIVSQHHFVPYLD
jgi:phosphate transport system substrate-binding protein